MEFISQLFATRYLWLSLAIFLMLFLLVGIPRIRMEIRAKTILSQMPNHEIKSFFVPFDSASPSGKRAIMDKVIAQMEGQGWIYLKSGEANPFKTIYYWGGGLNMYFIRNLHSTTNSVTK